MAASIFIPMEMPLEYATTERFRKYPIWTNPFATGDLQIRPPAKHVYTSPFSTGKPNYCNDTNCGFHASESINLFFGATRQTVLWYTFL